MNNIKFLFRKFILFFFLILLSSCAPKLSTQIEITAYENAVLLEEAEKRWDIMKEHEVHHSPILVDGSLRFGYNNKSQRANFLLWTNDGSVARVDINAGFTTYANIYANATSSNYLGIYLLTQNTLLESNNVDYRDGFSVLDIEFPFSIHTLIDIINGSFSYYFDEKYEKIYEEVGQDIFTYKVNVQSDNEFISLNALGRVIEWSFNDWTLEFSYKDLDKPSKISATNVNGDFLTIFISNIQEKDNFAQRSFELELQSGLKIRQLDEIK